MSTERMSPLLKEVRHNPMHLVVERVADGSGRAADLARRSLGLYLDVPPWQCHVFEMTRM